MNLNLKAKTVFFKPEKIGIVNSGLNRDICLDRYIWDRQYKIFKAPSRERVLSSEN